MNIESLQNYIMNITSKQLERLQNNILIRIWERFAGGMMFGIDLSTVQQIAPGLAIALQVVQRERYQRIGL